MKAGQKVRQGKGMVEPGIKDKNKGLSASCGVFQNNSV